MASPIDAQVILCDAAQADPGSGKLHMLGAGWSHIGTPTSPHAVAVLIRIPWDRTNQKISLKLELVDGDGHPPKLADGQVLQIAHEGAVEAGRPPGMPPGSPVGSAFALNVPALPLPPGRYQWRLTLADEVFDASFTVRQS